MQKKPTNARVLKNVLSHTINYKHVSIAFEIIIIRAVLQTVLRIQQIAELCEWIHSAFDGCLSNSPYGNKMPAYILLKTDKIC